MNEERISKGLGQNKTLTEQDLQAIKTRAASIVPLGYLVTALSGSLEPTWGEEQAYRISILSRDDVPALIRSLQRAQAALDAANEREQVLRGALAFYAEANNYRLWAEVSDGADRCKPRYSGDGVIADAGLRARQALSATTPAPLSPGERGAGVGSTPG